MGGKHTFAIGDIHGCLGALEILLAEMLEKYPGGGKVIFLGDYVDRGPDSKGVIDLIMSGPASSVWEWVSLKGNHEDMMVGAIDGTYETEWWLGNGGYQTMASYGREPDPAHIEWMRQLPLIHVDKHRIFVHAGIDDSAPLDEQREQTMLWSRPPPHYSGHYWGKHLVHGHTPSESNPSTVGSRTNVDSAAVFGGKLSCVVFNNDVAGAPIDVISCSALKS